MVCSWQGPASSVGATVLMVEDGVLLAAASQQLAMFDYNVFYGSTNPTAAMLLFIAFE